LREEYGLRVSEDRVLWKIFGPQRDEVIGDGIMNSFMLSTPDKILFR